MRRHLVIFAALAALTVPTLADAEDRTVRPDGAVVEQGSAEATGSTDEVVVTPSIGSQEPRAVIVVQEQYAVTTPMESASIADPSWEELFDWDPHPADTPYRSDNPYRGDS